MLLNSLKMNSMGAKSSKKFSKQAMISLVHQSELEKNYQGITKNTLHRDLKHGRNMFLECLPCRNQENCINLVRFSLHDNTKPKLSKFTQLCTIHPVLCGVSSMFVNVLPGHHGCCWWCDCWRGQWCHACQYNALARWHDAHQWRLPSIQCRPPFQTPLRVLASCFPGLVSSPGECAHINYWEHILLCTGSPRSLTQNQKSDGASALPTIPSPLDWFQRRTGTLLQHLGDFKPKGLKEIAALPWGFWW